MEISARQNVKPGFWAVLDYLIFRTAATLKKSKTETEKEITLILRPLYEKYNSILFNVYRNIPDNDYYYIKEELKTFHHILTHTLNLIDRNLSHFIPSFLFVELIEKMKLITPSHTYCCNPPFFARENYFMLMARYLSGKFSNNIKKVFDTLLWHKETAPYIIQKDREHFRKFIIDAINSAIKEKSNEHEEKELTIHDVVVELRNMVTLSVISEKLFELLSKVENTPLSDTIDAGYMLHELSLIFVQENINDNRFHTLVRDITLLTTLISKSITAIRASNKKMLFEQVSIFRKIKEFYTEITIFLVPIEQFPLMLSAIEFMDFISASYPSSIHDSVVLSKGEKLADDLRKTASIFEERNNIKLDSGEIELFIDKLTRLKLLSED